MIRKICGMLENEFCKSADLLLSKEFQSIVNTATQGTKRFIQVDLLLQTGPEFFQLFYLSDHNNVFRNEPIEQLRNEGAVIQKPITISKSTDHSSNTRAVRTEMQNSIARFHGYRSDEYCWSSAMEIKYKEESVPQEDAPVIRAVLFIRREEWPYCPAITTLFFHFITNINKSKNAFSTGLLHAINLQQAKMSINNASEIIHRSCESYLEMLFKSKDQVPFCEETPLFRLVCNLACMPYEGRTNRGLIRFPASSPKTSSIIAFQHPVSCSEENKREIRKLLEMTDDETALLVSNNDVIGMTKDKVYKSYINFSGNGKWSIHRYNLAIPFISVEGNSCKYHVISQENEFQQAYQQVFKDSGNYSAIKAIVDSAKKQKHGTAIVVSENADAEASRLSSYTRAICITPHSLVNSDLSVDEKLIRSLTSIDGALIISPDGICYAIGAILDGEACCPGLTARGARYNSLLNYVKWKKSGVLAIVISEDQSIDYIK